MTVAFDAFSNSAAGTTERSWQHTPVGTPRGVIVFAMQNAAIADGVTGVTYGGDSLTEVSGSPNLHTTGEIGGVHCFFLGSSIPTGEQTVVVSISGVQTRIAGVITLTAADDLEVVDSDGTIESDALANPRATLSLSGRTSFAAIGFHSGRQAVGNITPLTDWTARLEHDFGAQLAGWYTFNTIGSSDVTAGWDQAEDDATMIALAISEPAGAGVGIPIAMYHHMKNNLQ